MSAQKLVSNLSFSWTNISKENFLKASLVRVFDSPHDMYFQVKKGRINLLLFSDINMGLTFSGSDHFTLCEYPEEEGDSLSVL